MIENKRYDYGCEGKEYYVGYYPNNNERQEKYGFINKVYGTIENFNPCTQTAIKNSKGELILIDSKLIAIMRPMNKSELECFKKDGE